VPAEPRAPDDVRIVHREFLVLGVVVAAAIVFFMLARVMAAAAHEAHAATALEWYADARAQAGAGHRGAAIASLRKAVVNAPQNRAYAVALGSLLRLDGRLDDAEAVLQRARDSAPDDAEVSLELARISAARHDVTASARLYRGALYGTWPAANGDAILAVRLELARMLLENGQQASAVSELAVAASGADSAAADVAIGSLLLEAGEGQRASEVFARALRVSPDDAEALAGGGESAFQLGAYRDAVRSFRRAGASKPLDPRYAEHAALAELIVAHDPLAPRLTPEERLRRLDEDLDAVGARLAACRPAGPADPDLVAMRASLRLDAVRRDPGLIDEGVALIDRLERDACGTPDALHVALQLLAKTRGPEGH
jgi:Flp pilus assembly protein TadD